MRFIPANCLTPGQVLGQELRHDKHRVLLRTGVPLTASMIRKIKMLGFQGVYIDDDYSKDIYIANVISDELRHKAQNEIRALFVTLEQKQPKNRAAAQIMALGNSISNIVDEIMRNRQMMLNIIDIRAYDDYTYSHSINVAVLSVILGTVLKMDRKTLNELAMGALLHDIGKVFIDKDLINKSARLTPEELDAVHNHSQLGYDYLIGSKAVPESAKLAILSHHEQFNGKGYPQGLSGEDIPLFARIICVADVYDALVSDRPYRTAMLPSDVIEYIMSGYNTMFDPKVVDAFLKKVAPYPVGTCVRLSSGQVGIIVENFENTCLRPKIRLIADGKLTDDYLDLAHDYDALSLTIKEIVELY